MARDHILLQTKHVIALALDSGRRQYLRRFLEGRSRDPALRTKRSLRNTQEQRRRSGGIGIPEFSQLLIVPAQDGILFPYFPQTYDLSCFQLTGFARIGNDLLVKDPVVLFEEFELIDRIFFEESCITRIDDRQLTHHLANDHLDMLVIDLHTLKTINFLDLIHNVFLNSKRSLDRKNIRRSYLTIGQLCAGLDKVTILCKDLPCQRNKILLHNTILGFHDDLAVTTFDITKSYHTVDLADDSRVARITCLEQLRYAGQTTRDIPQLTKYTGDLHDYLTSSHRITFFDDDMRTYRQVIVLYFLVPFDVDRRDLRLVFCFDNHFFTVTSLFIRFFPIGDTFEYSIELDITGDLRDHNVVERIP